MGLALAGPLNPSPALPVDAGRLKGHVEFLATQLGPRNLRHKASLDSASDYIEHELVALGYQVQRQVYQADTQEVWNVLATAGAGQGPTVVVGAHYDVWRDQPGADDNASGVAGLLELARILKLNESRLHNQVELVFYTLEEPPWYDTPQMGSYVHAASLKATGKLPRLMLSLEMIGYYTPKHEQDYPLGILKLFFPRSGNFISVVANFASAGDARSLWQIFNRRTALPAEYIAAPAWVEGVDWSDHRSYWRYGVRALMITDTSFYRNRMYHSKGDTPDRLDFDKMAEVVRAVALFLFAGVK
jgi:Zn-dependent M28 family amino/carboxypeptidase